MPLGLIAPAVEDIVTEQFVVEAAPACDDEPLGACVVVEEAPGRFVDVVAAPVVDPACGIVDVGTANGSEPQLGAPNMKPISALDVEQNVMPPELPFVPPDRFPLAPEEEDGLDAVAGTEFIVLPGAGLVCAELVWACAAPMPARRIIAKIDARSIEPSLSAEPLTSFARHDYAPIHN
jgi:hypothetical protein